MKKILLPLLALTVAAAMYVRLHRNDPYLYRFFGDANAPAPGTAPRFPAGPVTAVAEFDDVRWKDLSGVRVLPAERIKALTFNQRTRWPEAQREIARDLLERGKNPGLGVRSLHAEGITGAGVSVGIIDQPLLGDHPEYKDRVAAYRQFGKSTHRASMHGPAVLSLLAGRSTGTAPGANVYFGGCPGGDLDARHMIDALNWLIETSAKLPPDRKIRVVSVSAAPGGPGSPFKQNTELWDPACARAAAAGILVLDCTQHRAVVRMCYYDIDAPDDLARVTPGYPGRPWQPRPEYVLAPSSRRVSAEEYMAGEFAYQYSGRGGLSWAIPYASGVLALAWQVNPRLTADRMLALLRESAYHKDGDMIIDPVAFIKLVRQQSS